MRKLLFHCAVLALCCFGATEAMAAWTLDSSRSQLSYVTVKKTHVMEVHKITGLSGKVDDGGKAMVEIDFASVDSGVEVRDERLRKFLFQVASYAKARFSSELDISDYSDMKVGESREGVLEGEMSMVGLKKVMDFEVIVTRISENEVMIVPNQQIVVTAKEFGLDDEVEKLRTIAKLPNITNSISMNFRLFFKNGPA